VAHLLLRFYHPGQGRILLDGHDIRDLGLAAIADDVMPLTGIGRQVPAGAR
jgi:ABC-type multidrug transport system fused ATPase/permease subunit